MKFKKSKESVSRGAERILNIQHPRTYKDDVANFSSGASIPYLCFSLTTFLVNLAFI
ncbi:palindromic element RPE5 domain-containing protein [Rickettsia felis]|nr:palindromic element RPE5 domain-containing protein [Rickettsia endosymbiont of Sceptobius lativentris]MDE8611203.1 palindromic element RPE5 domain-containing protein [Rickettsia felis]